MRRINAPSHFLRRSRRSVSTRPPLSAPAAWRPTARPPLLPVTESNKQSRPIPEAPFHLADEFRVRTRSRCLAVVGAHRCSTAKKLPRQRPFVDISSRVAKEANDAQGECKRPLPQIGRRRTFRFILHPSRLHPSSTFSSPPTIPPPPAAPRCQRRCRR
jgi:hypothetical protein